MSLNDRVSQDQKGLTMPAEMPAETEFIGGPRDGDRLCLPDSVNHVTIESLTGAKVLYTRDGDHTFRFQGYVRPVAN